MAILRLEALNELAQCIAERIPALKGRICAGPAESPHRLQFPSLVIDPVRFRYFPDQAAEPTELSEPAPTGIPPKTVLLNVGRHEGTVQLRLGAGTKRLRAELEQKILNLFLEREGAPGVLVMTVPQCHNALIAWELDTDEWENEKAFDKKWYSVLTVAAQIPALVTRGSVHTIEEIRLTLTEDLQAPISDVPASAQETVTISTDGTVSTAAGP